ncbi:MAG: tagatose 1,6-diphosphate aldolase [Verrucomicrobia bacterium]|nr:tagatose 1,6-diphosphate aldolase [Verrucomicrobiota bacterium]
MNNKTLSIDPGKWRSLQRVTTKDGFFFVCALDHLSDFQELLAPNPRAVDYKQTVNAKIELIRALAPECSAFLLDARFGLAPAIVSGALPGSVGLMASIEDEDYKPISVHRKTRFREHWSVEQMKLMGVDVCKLLWFYRPDSKVAEHQREVVRSLVNSCARFSLPLVVEPIWFALEGEDAKSESWRKRRVEGILESAQQAEVLGADLLKVEFPGYVQTEAGREKALEACKQLDASVKAPWMLLSAGVGYEAFRWQVEIAARSGGSGFMAGRSIWRDAASVHNPVERERAVRQARDRLAELGTLTRKFGKPLTRVLEPEKLSEVFPEGWYATWHRTGAGTTS